MIGFHRFKRAYIGAICFFIDWFTRECLLTLQMEELQQLDQDYRGLLNKGVVLAENVIAAKISKPQYQTEDSNLSSKKVGLIEKMEAITEAL